MLELCTIVVTFCGGFQKGAHFFNKYCFTRCEKFELVEVGVKVFVECDANRVVAETRKNPIGPARLSERALVGTLGNMTEKIVERDISAL